MATNPQTTLRPCPFCGNPSVVKGTELIGHGEYAELVKCTNCSAQISDWKGKPEDKWNRRYEDHQKDTLESTPLICRGDT